MTDSSAGVEVSPAVDVTIESRFQGPPMMGHGGYVAGLLAERVEGAAQMTLRRPIPLDTPLRLVDTDNGGAQLLHGEDLLVEAEPSSLDLVVPPAPSLADARAAEAGSPSHYDGRGVHPTCFGCGAARENGLRVFVGPISVDGKEQVAGTWAPAPFAEEDGTVARRWVVAALDCPGAFAFISREVGAGLLGRIVFEQHGDVRGGSDHIVTGWQVGTDGRKLFAGTALFDAAGTLLASAKATWFPWTPK